VHFACSYRVFHRWAALPLPRRFIPPFRGNFLLKHDAFPSLPRSQSQSPLNMQCLRSAFLFESASGVSLLPFSLAFLPFWHLARALSKWVLKGGFPAIKCVCVWCGGKLFAVTWAGCSSFVCATPYTPSRPLEAIASHPIASCRASSADDWHFGRPGFAVVIVMLLSSLLSSTWLHFHYDLVFGMEWNG